MSENHMAAQDLSGFLTIVTPPPVAGEVFVIGQLPKKKSPKDCPPMRHSHFATHEEMKSAILSTDATCGELYFALARYKPHTTPKGNPGRQASYATAVKAFWLDIDCSPEKAASGDGYQNQKEAAAAFSIFLSECGLPKPTIMVSSGGGIHVYFVLHKAIAPETWKPVAEKLKQLTIACGFKADPARTADIASVLRPPLTQNLKLQTPRPVKIRWLGQPCEFTEFKVAIESALLARNAPTLGTADVPAFLAGAESNFSLQNIGTPDLAKLQSALAVLDPDCEEPIWKLQRIAPLAREAKLHPQLCDQIKELARQWSRGDLFKKADQ